MPGIRTVTFTALVFNLSSLILGQNETLNFCSTSTQIYETIPAALMMDGISQKFSTRLLDINCKSNEVLKTTTVTNPSFMFYDSGHILVGNEDYILKQEYCITSVSATSISIKSCEVKCGETHTCIFKCCPLDQFIDVSAHDGSRPVCKKVKKAESWKPVFYQKHEGCGEKVDEIDYHVRLLQEEELAGDLYLYPYTHTKWIDVNSTIQRIDGNRFRLMHNGNLMSSQINGKWVQLLDQEFCIDGTTGHLNGDDHVYRPIQDQVFVSFEFAETENVTTNHTDEENQTTSSSFGENADNNYLEYYYIGLMLLGAIFLALTSTVYLLIWEKHNIHGWTIFGFVSTMFFMFIFLAVSKILSICMTDEFGGDSSCVAIGIMTHFFHLSTMCWLSVINFDLWLTFRNIRPGTTRAQNVKRFLLYSMFAFGVPFCIVAFSVSIDMIHRGSHGDGNECELAITLPLYGIGQCAMQHDATLYYTYIPMKILLATNILTFSSTVFSLCMYRNKTKNVASNTSQNEALILFGKLFIVTGLSWILEVMSFWIPELWWLWIIPDTYNLLQAVLIFVIFGLKRENCGHLYQNYPKLRILLSPLRRFYMGSYDMEKTEMTGVTNDQRYNVHFKNDRRGSNFSTS